MTCSVLKQQKKMSDPFIERFESLVANPPRNWNALSHPRNWRAVESLLDTMPSQRRDSKRWKLVLYNCVCLEAPQRLIDKCLEVGIALFSRPSRVLKMLHNADFDKFKFYVSKMDKIDGTWLSEFIDGRCVEEKRLLFLIQHGANPFVVRQGQDHSVYAKLQKERPMLTLQARFSIFSMCAAICHPRLRRLSPLGVLPIEILRSLLSYVV